MKVLHVIARVNLVDSVQWQETLTAEQLTDGDEVVLATGQVQGDEVEDPDAASMPLVRLERLVRAVSPLNDALAVRELCDLIGDLRPDVVHAHTGKAGLAGRAAGLSLGSSRSALVHTVHGHLFTGKFPTSVVWGIVASE